MKFLTTLINELAWDFYYEKKFREIVQALNSHPELKELYEEYLRIKDKYPKETFYK